MRERIIETMAHYAETFAHYANLSWPEAALLAEQFREPIAAYDEEILAELDGMAAGASLRPADILAINARTEIMFGYSSLPAVPPAECTSFFAGPEVTADGNSLLGQNWDWRPRAAASTTLLEIDPCDRPAFMMLVEAGLIGKIGFNSAGVGTAVNMLISDVDEGNPLVPVHVLMRAALAGRDIEEAVAAVVRSHRGSSLNMVIADSDGTAVDLEVGPGGIANVVMIPPQNDVITHSNHFTCARSFFDVGANNYPDSLERIARLRELIEAEAGSLTAEKMTGLMSDHATLPNAICKHLDEDMPDVERFKTVASWVVDLTTQTVLIAAGNPCESAYQPLRPNFAV
jgi:isopenicillin-N N-acyltransferase-like protein